MEPFTAYRVTQTEAGIDAGFVRCTLDELDAGDVVVRVAYSDVNYKDALAATGAGRILRRRTCIGGIDLAGTVVSSADPAFAAGDDVCVAGYGLGVSHDGGYAEYARVPAGWLTPLPAGLSLWESMALGTAGLTAALAITRLEAAGLRPGDGPVLVTGATGGVGSIAIAALSRLGHHVVALTGKADETPWLERLGARGVIVRSTLDLTRISPLGKATWAGAIDNLGGDVLAWILSTTRPNGAVASIGLAAAPALQTTVMPFILRAVSLLGVNSSDAPSPAARAEAWRRLASDLKPPLLAEMARTVPFAALPEVFADFIAGTVARRVVVAISA